MHDRLIVVAAACMYAHQEVSRPEKCFALRLVVHLLAPTQTAPIWECQNRTAGAPATDGVVAQV